MSSRFEDEEGGIRRTPGEPLYRHAINYEECESFVFCSFTQKLTHTVIRTRKEKLSLLTIPYPLGDIQDFFTVSKPDRCLPTEAHAKATTLTQKQSKQCFNIRSQKVHLWMQFCFVIGQELSIVFCIFVSILLSFMSQLSHITDNLRASRRPSDQLAYIQSRSRS